MKKFSRYSEELLKERLYFLRIFFAGVFLLFSARIFFLQILHGRKYLEQAEGNRLSVFLVPALRGEILAGTRVLASNRISYSLIWSDPGKRREPEWLDELAGILGKNKKELQWNIITSHRRGYPLVYIMRRMSREEAIRLEEKMSLYPGLRILPEPVRTYPEPEAFSHVLGYIGEVTKAELKVFPENYLLGSLVGKDGLEKTFDRYLRGKEGGSVVEVDAQGRVVRLVEDTLPESGSSLRLALDPDLQTLAYALLGGKRGVVLGADPDTGKMLVCVSSPGFDPEKFCMADQQEIEKIFRDTEHPLLNRTIQSRYSPGSVFKIILAMANIETNKFGFSEKIYCEGKFFLNNIEFACWKEEGHGEMDFARGIINSCNVYFYKLGLRLGVETISHYARLAGMNLKSEVELPYEVGGLVPDPSWKRKTHKYPWLPGDTVNLSIGQGWLSITPMEMLLMGMGVSGEGKIFRPYLVEGIYDENGSPVKMIEPEVLHSYELKKKTWIFLKENLRRVVEEGTGRGVRVEGLTLCGKTGTSQNPFGKPHSWFLSFNEDAKKMVLLVLVENGGMGSEVAVPISRAIWKKFKELNFDEKI
ncbi:MAG TPA: penicillin-binding protein 2 [bacterium]|nr:penicillin-binding protein 2 [bacterium]